MLDVRCMSCMELYDGTLESCPYCGFDESKYKRIGYHLQLNTTLNDTYIVGKTIGYGGFGITYIGYNAILEKKVAIKEYLPGEFATRSPGDSTITAFTGDKEKAYYKGLEQFEKEAKRLASLKNKTGIVDIYDSFRENNTVYIVMEYLEGETVKELLNRKKRLSIDKATHITMEVLKSLKYVHSEGIVHRDISPENIFITASGDVKLIDFGAARNATTAQSKSLSVIIKQGYAPPEQYYSKGKQGPWTDVYAVAATYYKMLTGTTPVDSMERCENDTLISPTKFKIRISKHQEIALFNALVLDANKRTQTAEGFLVELTGEAMGIKKIRHSIIKRDLGKTSLKTKILICIGSVAVIVAFALGIMIVRDNIITDQETLEEDQIYMPNVLNLPYEEAEVILKDAGLTPKVKSWKSNESMPANIVLHQEVAAGQLVYKGTEIGLTLSNEGGLEVYVDDYVGLSKDEVVEKLDELQLYAEFEYKESAMAKGCVISQDIKCNEAIKKGNIVKLQVSTGLSGLKEGKVNVPDLIGKNFDECMNMLADEKLHIKVKKVTYNRDIPKGEIISQSYKTNTIVAEGTVIEVEISGGVQMIRIPNIDFYDCTEAKKTLEAMGFDVVIDYDGVRNDENKRVSNGVVLADVSYGDLVEVGSRITLYNERGIEITTSISEPKNIYGNTYNVGDDVRVTLHIDYEEFGISSGWDMELGIDYDDDILEFKQVEGNATAEFGANHDKCGQWCLYQGNNRRVTYYPEDDQFLTLYHSFVGPLISENVTLVFEAKKKGSTNVNVFMITSYKSKSELWLHMWPTSDIQYDFYHTSNFENFVNIDVE